VFGHPPPAVSCNLTPQSLHGSMFRVVRPIKRYTSARKGTCRFLLSQRYLKQWWILGFLNSLCSKGSLVYWILEDHQHIIPRGNSTNGQPYLVYLTTDIRRIKLLSWLKSRVITFSLITISVILVILGQTCTNITYVTSLSTVYLRVIRQEKHSLTNSKIKA